MLSIELIATAFLINLSKQLGRLRQLELKEIVRFYKLVPLTGCDIRLALQAIKSIDLGLGFSHLFSAFLAELVMMGSQKSDLFEQNMVFFSQEMQSFTHAVSVLVLITTFMGSVP
jgi:hypothetical protein